MSIPNRASSSSSSGEPPRPKRPRWDPNNQGWNGCERNLDPGRHSMEEEDVRRMIREELDPLKSLVVKFLESFGNDLEDVRQRFCSTAPELRRAKELPNLHSPNLARGITRSAVKNDPRNLQLQFQTKLSLPIYTERKLKGVGGACISVALVDADTGEFITSGPESSIKLEVVVLEGDFNKDNWIQEEFENNVVKEREGKRPLVVPNLQVTLNEGVGQLGNLTFTDNSSWTRSKTFRVGLKVATGYCANRRILEAKTEPFRVTEYRGAAYGKHHPPAPDDQVWRLGTIAKYGKFHQKLKEAGIHKVEDLLLQLLVDSRKLREILGNSMRSTNWDILVDHAKTCKTNRKLFCYYPDGRRMHGAIFTDGGQLIGLIKDAVYWAAHRLSDQEEKLGETIVKKASDNWNDVLEFKGGTFSRIMQSFQGQNENLNLASRTYATPVGPDAPPANAGSTAEGHNGITALPLLARSQNTNCGHAREFSVNESIPRTAHQHISADCSNVPISLADTGITPLGLSKQSPNINLQNATGSQMIDSSSQMDYAVDELVLRSEPPHASSSSFPPSSTFPPPEGNHVMEDFQSDVGNDMMAQLWDYPTNLSPPSTLYLSPLWK